MQFPRKLSDPLVLVFTEGTGMLLLRENSTRIVLHSFLA